MPPEMVAGTDRNVGRIVVVISGGVGMGGQVGGLVGGLVVGLVVGSGGGVLVVTCGRELLRLAVVSRGLAAAEVETGWLASAADATERPALRSEVALGFDVAVLPVGLVRPEVGCTAPCEGSGPPKGVR